MPLIEGEVDAFPPTARRGELALVPARPAVLVVRTQVDTLVLATVRPGAPCRLANFWVLPAIMGSRVPRLLGKEAISPTKRQR